MSAKAPISSGKRQQSKQVSKGGHSAHDMDINDHCASIVTELCGGDGCRERESTKPLRRVRCGRLGHPKKDDCKGQEGTSDEKEQAGEEEGTAHDRGAEHRSPPQQPHHRSANDDERGVIDLIHSVCPSRSMLKSTPPRVFEG